MHVLSPPGVLLNNSYVRHNYNYTDIKCQDKFKWFFQMSEVDLNFKIKAIGPCMSPAIRLILARLVEWTTEKEKAPLFKGLLNCDGSCWIVKWGGFTLSDQFAFRQTDL
jgi:hypothetical protein